MVPVRSCDFSGGGEEQVGADLHGIGDLRFLKEGSEHGQRGCALRTLYAGEQALIRRVDGRSLIVFDEMGSENRRGVV